jgi:hypothetical protein
MLALTTAPMLWTTIRTSNNPLRFLLPKVTSRSVIARINPHGELRQEVVLLGCISVWGKMWENKAT